MLLSRIPWPLEKGDKLRAFHQIRCLAAQHDIYLCALNAQANVDIQQAYKALQPYCKSVTFVRLRPAGIAWNVLKAIVSGKPIQVGYFYNSKANKTIRQLIQTHRPDVVYGQLLRVAAYLEDVPLPKALDYQDVFSQGMARRANVAAWPVSLIYKLEFLRLRKYERRAFDIFDLKTIISATDRDLIPHPSNHEIVVIPNGVDQQFFAPDDQPRTFDLVFTGNMAYPPNVNAAEFLVHEIMPLVWARRPQTNVLIAGATPDRRVKALQSNLVHVSGWLDDIRDAYRAARVFIAPMRIGTGLQNKLLEAMSMGLPCITTPLAHQALGGQAGIAIMVAQQADELANAVLELLQNPEKAAAMSSAGQDFVKRNYHWESATRRLAEALSAIAAGKTSDETSR
ncbi:MAG: glycosyltransferase [Bacteroidetes bacterium]|nr:glycosyltransferase [Bacteroidota bacterium]